MFKLFCANKCLIMHCRWQQDIAHSLSWTMFLSRRPWPDVWAPLIMTGGCSRCSRSTWDWTHSRQEDRRRRSWPPHVTLHLPLLILLGQTDRRTGRHKVQFNNKHSNLWRSHEHEGGDRENSASFMLSDSISTICFSSPVHLPPPTFTVVQYFPSLPHKFKVNKDHQNRKSAWIS